MADRKYYVICDIGCKFESMTKEQIYTAIMQAVNEGTIGDIDTGFVTTIKTINEKSLKFFYGTQSEYEALTDEDKTGLFAIITNDTSKEALENALAELQTNYDALTKNLADGSFVVAKATNAGYATSAGSASSATSATRATKDGSGNTISTTYAKKSDLPVIVSVEGEVNLGSTSMKQICSLPSGKSITDIHMVQIREVEDSTDKPMMVGFGVYPFVYSDGRTTYRMRVFAIGGSDIKTMTVEFAEESGIVKAKATVKYSVDILNDKRTELGDTFDNLTIWFK